VARQSADKAHAETILQDTGTRHPVIRWLFAFATVGCATVLRWWMDPILHEHHPFTLYFAAVALTAWYGGFAQAVLATLLSYLAADWFFITPRFAFNLPHTNLDEFLALIGFVFSCLAIAITSHRMRLAQAALHRHADELEQKVRERTRHLEEAVRSLQGVCYHIAHDLRAPLRAMHGYSSVLKSDYAEVLDDTGTQYLNSINEASGRMDLLIRGLLDFGRLGHEDFPLGPTAPDRVLNRVVERFSDEIAQTAAQFERDGPFRRVEANPTLLEIALSELISNALKFTPPGTPPRIRVYAQELSGAGLVRFAVEDHGIGIPPDYQSRAFSIFERIHPVERYPGTGIGLALASKAVERMNGLVGLRSTPGRGSTFWFDLHLSAEHKPQLASAPEALGKA